MTEAIQLFGYLILTLLGFVIPIVGILLSVYQEGIAKLRTQYENERAQSEKNIKEQLKKVAESEKTDMSEVQESLNKLKAIRRTAEDKLSYLDPPRQITRLFLPLILAFVAVLVALVLRGNERYLALAAGAVPLMYTIASLRVLMGILTEVKKTIDTDRRDVEAKTVELLSTLVQKIEKGSQYFLTKVYAVWDGRDVRQEMEEKVSMVADKKEEIPIAIKNSETRMAKNVEIGFIFPADFLIEKASMYNLFTDENSKIVRFMEDAIHGSTNVRQGKLLITALKKGEYTIRTFVKAENMEARYTDMPLVVS